MFTVSSDPWCVRVGAILDSVLDFHTSMSFALNSGLVSELVRGGN